MLHVFLNISSVARDPYLLIVFTPPYICHPERRGPNLRSTLGVEVVEGQCFWYCSCAKRLCQPRLIGFPHFLTLRLHFLHVQQALHLLAKFIHVLEVSIN